MSLYSDVVKGDPSPTWLYKETSGRGRRRSREKGNQEVGDFRFINILQLFSIFFSITLLYYFFLHFIYPRHLPTSTIRTGTHTTSTHYQRPTTFSYTPPSLLLLALKVIPWFCIAHLQEPTGISYCA